MDEQVELSTEEQINRMFGDDHTKVDDATNVEPKEEPKEEPKSEQPKPKLDISIPKYRFDEVNTKAKKLEIRAAELEAELAKYRTTAESKTPSLHDYEDPDEWAAKIREQTIAESKKAILEEIKREQEASESVKTQNERIRGFQEKVENLEKEAPGSIEIITNVDNSIREFKIAGGTIHPALEDAILSSDYSEKLYLEFGKTNMELLANLIQAPPEQAIRMIGRLEAKFEMEKSQAQKAKSAPIPKTVNKTVSGSTSDLNDPNLSDEEWFKAFDKKYARRRGK